MEITDPASAPNFSFPFVLDCHQFYELMVTQGEGRSPMTSSDAKMDSKLIIIIIIHRYTVRHNAVLSLLIGWLRSNISCQQRLYADLVDVNVLPVCDSFQSYRPDTAVICADSIYVLELTVCHESNMIHSHDYKKN